MIPVGAHYQHVQLIINPRAGKRLFFVGTPYMKINRKNPLAAIKAALQAIGITPRVTVTRYKNHATDIARACVNAGCDLVIVAGGDGSVNEVINGLAGSDVPLAVIPIGTANVYAREMALPRDLATWCHHLQTTPPRAIDLGQVNGRYFICMAGVGFDAAIIQLADRGLKRVLGPLAYLVAVLYGVLRYQQGALAVTIDHQPSVITAQQVVVTNAKYYGGPFVVAAQASMTDGQLQVCCLKTVSVWSLLQTGYQLIRGGCQQAGPVQVRACQTVQITSPAPIHADAEYIGTGPVTLQVVPQALKVIA